MAIIVPVFFLLTVIVLIWFDCRLEDHVLRRAVLEILRSHGELYGVPLYEEASKLIGRDVSFGALYGVLNDLERKGLIVSRAGEVTSERGNRRRRYFAAVI